MPAICKAKSALGLDAVFKQGAADLHGGAADGFVVPQGGQETVSLRITGPQVGKTGAFSLDRRRAAAGAVRLEVVAARRVTGQLELGQESVHGYPLPPPL